MANKHIDLFKEIIPLIDLGIKHAYRDASEDERKEMKGDMFNLTRYISSVKSNNRELQEHFVLTVNEYYNKHWNTLQKHPALLWMLLSICSYDKQNTYFHEWIGYKKKGTNSSNKKAKFIESIYPTMKYDEIELLSTLITDKEIKDLARDHGMEESAVAKLLK